MQYRSEIDGLRALAVVPVILFHAGFELFSGGFVGVDVFFVISGYLITTILIDDIENNRFSILNFYERRARRILPALFFVMLICIPFAWMWMLPDPLENFGQSLVATIFFANNILLLITSGYWELASEFKPLVHTWSLGVEEQYYLFFPLLLMILWRFAKAHLFLVIVALALTSLMLSEAMWRDYPNVNFYLIFTRTWELFAGSIATLILRQRAIKENNFLSMFGLAAIVISIFTYDESTPFPSVYTLVPVVGVVLLVLFSGKETITTKLLSMKVFVSIGLISYSAYLWHQPLLAFAKIYNQTEPTLAINGFLVVVTFLFAYISWRYVETPFRKKQVVTQVNFSVLVIVIATAITIFGYGAHRSHGFPDRVFDDSSDISEMYISYNERNFEFERDDFESNADIKILIIGNSYGRDIVNVIRETYDLNNVSLVYRSDLSDCDVLNSSFGNRLFKDANIVLFASNYDYSNAGCINSVIDLSDDSDNNVFFIGTKHFGYNLNWIARVDKDQRSLLRNELLLETINSDLLTKAHIPQKNYISILDGISNEDGVVVTDEIGRLISGDRTHLTRYGAEFIGKEVMLPSSITSLLTLTRHD